MPAGWGNHFADVEAWGGHQGGGMHGAYIGGKYSLNGYIEVKPIGTVVDEAWGTCGSWSVIRPSRAETVNPCVVAAENADCSISNPSACIDGWIKCKNEDGVLSKHGWASNILRVKFTPTAGAGSYGGPYFIKMGVNEVVDAMGEKLANQNGKPSYADVTADVCDAGTY